MKIAHLLSGGIDSTVLLSKLVVEQNEVHCLLFHYGQRHAKELDYAQASCLKLNVPYTVIELTPSLFARSTITGGMRKVDLEGSATVVPNRNMVFLAMAASFALTNKREAVSWAANADDARHYPDCRAAFYGVMQAALLLCDNEPIKLLAPYLHKTKKEVVREAGFYGVDLNDTWSCYAGGNTPCGACGACKARDAACS